MKDINVEFAHIYTNETISSEHYRAAQILKENKVLWEGTGLDYSVCVLIDDYNPSESFLDVGGFLKELELIEAKPDYVVWESSLVGINGRLLNDMSGKIKREYESYIEKNNKYPCSFLVAVWNLLRLGVYSSDSIESLSGARPFSDKSDYCGKQIISILPARYAGVEKKALDIIRSTDYYDSVKDKISHILF